MMLRGALGAVGQVRAEQDVAVLVRAAVVLDVLLVRRGADAAAEAADALGDEHRLHALRRQASSAPVLCGLVECVQVVEDLLGSVEAAAFGALVRLGQEDQVLALALGDPHGVADVRELRGERLRRLGVDGRGGGGDRAQVVLVGDQLGLKAVAFALQPA